MVLVPVDRWKGPTLKRFARRAAVAAALAAAPVLFFAGPAFASTASATAAVAQADSAAYEAQVVALTNVQRKAHGCRALRNDSRLAKAARAHSTDMVKQRFFSHTGSGGSTFAAREATAGYPRQSASGENIAWGFRTPRDVVTGWMNSPGHRANILNCGSAAVGVGLAHTAAGAAYWTQDFGRS
jgi:uncharacterized protein YkwD